VNIPTKTTMNSSNHSEAGPANPIPLLSDSEDEEHFSEMHENTTKTFKGKGKSKSKDKGKSHIDEQQNSVNIENQELLGKEIYDEYTKTHPYMSENVVTKYEAVMNCFKVLEQISDEYKSTCSEENELHSKKEHAISQYKSLEISNEETVRKLLEIQEIVKNNIKSVTENVSSSNTLTLFENQKYAETLKEEKIRISDDISKIQKEIEKCTNMIDRSKQRQTDLKSSESENLQILSSVLIELYTSVQEEKSNGKKYPNGDDMDSLNGDATSSFSESSKEKTSNDTLEDCISELTWNQKQQYITSKTQYESMLETTQSELHACYEKYKELQDHKNAIKFQLKSIENSRIIFEDIHKDQFIDFKEEKFNEIKSILREKGIYNAIMYYGIKSKDKLFSVTSYNSRFCIDNLEGTVYFFKEDWTFTKSLTLSEENSKFPMSKRVKCISETEDFNYDLSQMKLVILSVDGKRINPRFTTE